MDPLRLAPALLRPQATREIEEEVRRSSESNPPEPWYSRWAFFIVVVAIAASLWYIDQPGTNAHQENNLPVQEPGVRLRFSESPDEIHDPYAELAHDATTPTQRRDFQPLCRWDASQEGWACRSWYPDQTPGFEIPEIAFSELLDREHFEEVQPFVYRERRPGNHSDIDLKGCWDELVAMLWHAIKMIFKPVTSILQAFDRLLQPAMRGGNWSMEIRIDGVLVAGPCDCWYALTYPCGECDRYGSNAGDGREEAVEEGPAIKQAGAIRKTTKALISKLFSSNTRPEEKLVEEARRGSPTWSESYRWFDANGCHTSGDCNCWYALRYPCGECSVFREARDNGKSGAEAGAAACKATFRCIPDDEECHWTRDQPDDWTVFGVNGKCMVSWTAYNGVKTTAPCGCRTVPAGV